MMDKALRELKKSDPVKILGDMVAIPSYKKEEEVADYLARRLKPLDIKCRRRKIAPGRYNLVATLGRGKRSLLLNTHMDTVPPGDPDDWASPPLRMTRKGNNLVGRGCCDAKGSLAPMVAAIEALARSGVKLGGKLILQAVAAEESGGLGTSAEVAAGVQADAALVGEPTDLLPCIANKGVIWFRITLTGKSGHASSPEKGINPIVSAADLVNRLGGLAETIGPKNNRWVGSPKLTVTGIQAGQAPNVIPHTCSLMIDRRMIPGEDAVQARKEIEQVIRQQRKEHPGVKAKMNMERLLYFDSSQTDPNHPFVGVVRDSLRQVTGKRPRPVGFRAGCDMAFLVNTAQIPTLVLGPGSLSQAHAVNESIPEASVHQAARAYLAIAVNWLSNM